MKPNPKLFSLLIGSSFLAAVTTAHAQNFWDGDTSTDWGTAGNWSAGAPGSSSNVSFNSASYPNQPDLGSTARSVSTLTFGNNSTATSAVILSGTSTLEVMVASPNNSITMNSLSGAVTINPRILIGSTTITNNSSNVLTFTGGISSRGTSGVTTPIFTGSGTIEVSGTLLNAGNTLAITKSGTGTLILSGNNTGTGAYSSTTTITGGVIRLNNSSALGSGNLNMNGGILGLSAGDVSRTFGTAANQIRFTASSGFAAFGANRTITTATATWANTSGFLAGGQSLILSHATSDASITYASNISLGGAARTVQVDNGSAAVDAFISGALSGGSSGAPDNHFIKSGEGTLALTSNSNSYWGETRVTAGTLRIGNNGSAGILSENTTATVISAGATFAVNKSTAVSQNSGGGLGNGSAIISGAGGFAQIGTGTTTLTLNNTYSGGTTVNRGTLTVGTGGTLGASTGTLSVNNTNTGAGIDVVLNLATAVNTTVGSLSGNISTPSSGTNTATINIANTRTLTVNQTTDTTFAGVLAGTGGGFTLGSGSTHVLTLSGNNTYTGDTTISAGVLQIGNGGTTGTLGNNSNTFIDSGAELRINRSTDSFGYAYSGQLSGSGTVNILDSRRFNFQNTNQTSSSNLAFTMGAGSILGINTSSAVTEVRLGELSGSGIIQRAGGAGGTATLVIGGKGTDSTYSGAITATEISIDKVGSGTLTLTNSNTFGGATTITAGTLQLGDGGSTGRLSATSSITNNANLTINRNNAFTQLTDLNNKAITSTGSFTQAGTGTTTLSLANTYSGGTSVNAGTLVINGDNSGATGAVTVASGLSNSSAVRLKGTGTIGGATTFAADPDGAFVSEETPNAQVGGIHSPGNSVGRQSFTNNLTYSQGSIFEWELGATLKDSNTAGALRGTDWDAVNVSGTLATTGTGAIFRVVLDGTTTFADSFWTQNRTWTDIFKTADAGSLVSFQSIFSGFEFYNYGGANGSLNNLGDISSYGSFSISGSTLNFAAIPEPTSALAGLLLTAGLLRRRRNGKC